MCVCMVDQERTFTMLNNVVVIVDLHEDTGNQFVHCGIHRKRKSCGVKLEIGKEK